MQDDGWTGWDLVQLDWAARTRSRPCAVVIVVAALLMLGLSLARAQLPITAQVAARH